MLKGLKVLSLACKCPFCRSEHNTKRDPMKVLNCKNEKDREQREYEKNGVTCLVIMLTFRVTVIKMSKITHFL